MNESPKAGVGIIVMREINGEQHLMLHQRRTELGQGFWGSGGGHLELGESLKEGALRELREEAGRDLKVKNVRFMGVMNFTEMKPKHYVDVSFVAEWESGEPVNASPRETTDWQWFPISKLPEPLFPPIVTYLEMLRTNTYLHDSKF